MPPADHSRWTDLLRHTLGRYDEALLRQVAGKLIRPRNQWPAGELIDRCADTTDDPDLIDRRLKDLEPAGRHLLALIGHSGQPLWAMGHLVELVLSLGHDDGLRPVFALLESGLLLPYLGEPVEGEGKKPPALKSFEQWLAFAGPDNLQVFAHPLAMTRELGEDLGMGDCPGAVRLGVGAPLEADGLEWPLRLAVLWQMASGTPLRRTQQGEFFKRDLERLGQDALLTTAGVEGLPAIPDPGFLAAAFAELQGVLVESDGEVTAGELPRTWQQGLPAALLSLWRDFPRVRGWDLLQGWRHGEPGGNPFPSACLLSLMLLSRLPDGSWADPAAVQAWVVERHPFWAQAEPRPSRLRDWGATFLLGLAYSLRLVQAAQTSAGEWVVRLSPLGRWALGLTDTPPEETGYPKTLLVQPNLEIIAYRQGMTPALLAQLTYFAEWKSLGSACLLQLGPECTYRALEAGLTFETILDTLERCGTRTPPPAVVDSLRTWADKRDRISVYPSAALLEFDTPQQLEDALARGFPGVRIAERLAVVPGESAIDYSLFRLTASRDYSATPEKCVDLDDDGLTLTVDVARSDLLLDSELSRFAEPIDRPGTNGRRRYQLTPESLARARGGGLNSQGLETWFFQRVGQPPSPAALLLLAGGQAPSPSLQRHLVLHVATAEQADGLLQWTATKPLIHSRLGPTALVVEAANVERLREQLNEAGIALLADPEAGGDPDRAK